MNRSVVVVLALIVVLVFPLHALAGPNAGGVLAVHDADLAYTVDTESYCDLGSAPASCDSIDTNVESSGSDNQRVWEGVCGLP